MRAAASGTITPAALDALYDDAVSDTLRRFEATGSPVVTDGEQRKPSFATYPVAGLDLTGGGVTIPFEDGHTRQLPVITTAPFRYSTYAWQYLDGARGKTSARLKQAVISASAISLMYPADGIPGYPREAFIEDLVTEAVSEIRGCLERGATVQIDFTEARLSLKLDPSGGLLGAFVDLNNQVLGRLTDDERARVGVHTCPGGDRDSTHSADIPYEQLLPGLFRMNVPTFFVELAGEADRERELRILGQLRRAGSADLRRRHRPDQSARRDRGRGSRPGARGREVHRSALPRHDRRLRLLAVRRRHVDVTGHRVREDPGPRHRNRAGLGRPRGLSRPGSKPGPESTRPGGPAHVVADRAPLARSAVRLGRQDGDVEPAATGRPADDEGQRER